MEVTMPCFVAGHKFAASMPIYTSACNFMTYYRVRQDMPANNLTY